MANNISNPGGIPPTTQLPNAAMSVGTVSSGAMPKKGKKKKGASLTQEQMMAQGLTAEQMTQMQLEEAIKESQNPAMRLKKLKNPLSFKSCLVNLLLFIILTLVVVFILAAYLPSLGLDKWNFGVLFYNMLEEFGIFRFFKTIGDWFASLGKKGEEVLTWFQLIK